MAILNLLVLTHHADPQDVIRVKVGILVVELLELVHQNGHQHPPNDNQDSSEEGKLGKRIRFMAQEMLLITFFL